MAGFSWNLLPRYSRGRSLDLPYQNGIIASVDPSPAYSYKRVTEY
jgi:hypothetical protein